MALARKAYRIEAMLGVGAVSEPAGDFRADAILHELNEIKRLVKPHQEISRDIIADYQKQFNEAYKLQAEIDTITEAISRTKHCVSGSFGVTQAASEPCRNTSKSSIKHTARFGRFSKMLPTVR